MIEIENLEEYLRKPRAKGVPIKLGNGQEWLFAKPKVGIAPRRLDDGSFGFDRTKAVVVQGDRYGQLLDSYIEADPTTELDCLLNCAVELLKPNYLAIEHQLAEILPKWFGDEENDAMWKAIAEVVIGRAPKPSPVG